MTGLFSEDFVSLLVYGAIAMTSLGAITMLVLLVRDLRAGRLW